jgi:hypothetical protein
MTEDKTFIALLSRYTLLRPGGVNPRSFPKGAEMKAGWSRKSYVTRGADPTQVVEWSNADLRITEFQQVYDIEFLHPTCPDLLETIITLLGTQLHEALEAEHDREEDERAQRFAEDGDPDYKIYGGA